MAMLTPTQLEFLRAQGVPLSKAFDASGMSRSAYQAEMEPLGMEVAFGVSSCKAGGHSLKTRSGHCPQCGTHHLAFLRRYDGSGAVYTAHSPKTGLVKVGTAESPHLRMGNLNSYGYGGANDWRVVTTVQCASRAGKVEFLAHRKLLSHQVSRTYTKTYRTVSCQELFSCPAAVASAAVEQARKDLLGC